MVYRSDILPDSVRECIQSSGKMLMKGPDVYMPLVDVHGVDCIIKKKDGTFIEVQIMVRLSEVADGDAA